MKMKVKFIPRFSIHPDPYHSALCYNKLAPLLVDFKINTFDWTTNSFFHPIFQSIAFSLECDAISFAGEGAKVRSNSTLRRNFMLYLC